MNHFECLDPFDPPSPFPNRNNGILGHLPEYLGERLDDSSSLRVRMWRIGSVYRHGPREVLACEITVGDEVLFLAGDYLPELSIPIDSSAAFAGALEHARLLDKKDLNAFPKWKAFLDEHDDDVAVLVQQLQEDEDL